MRKLFWCIYTRLRLWYLYHGGEIPYDESPEYYKCPICNWDTSNEEYPSENYIKTSNYYCGYEGYKSWTEHWKCPRCGTVFEVDDSN